MLVNSNELAESYFDWMYHIVCDDGYYNRVSYKVLLNYLFNKDYIPFLEMDRNREVDGIGLRRDFALDCNVPIDLVETNFELKKCSILEMMIALSIRGERIMHDPSLGDRTGQWFWNMIVSLGLNHMNDREFNEQVCDLIIFNFLHNQYEPYGKGGLFTLTNCNVDLTSVEIWNQFMWYLNEIGD